MLHFSVPYPMSPCHSMECSEDMGLIINLCAFPYHPRPACWLERSQAKTLLLPENLSDYVTEKNTGYTFKTRPEGFSLKHINKGLKTFL